MPVSDTPSAFNLRDELARIDRERAETQQFIAERRRQFWEEIRANDRQLARDWQVERYLGPALLVMQILIAGGIGFGVATLFLQITACR